MGKALDIDGGNNPTIGKRVLFFIKREGQFVKGWPARILENYGSLKHAPAGGDLVNGFCESAPQGQVIYKLKVETSNGDYLVDAYADSSRQPGTFDEYKDGDLRV